MVDYKNLRSAEQIAAEAPALTLTTLEKWRFHRERLGLTPVFVEIDANVYWDVRAFNAWLYDGKPVCGDYRDLRTVRDVLKRSALLESKLRHWLKYRQANGLNDAVIVKTLGRQGKLYIDAPAFNRWLTAQNGNAQYVSEGAAREAVDTALSAHAHHGRDLSPADGGTPNAKRP